MTLNYKECANCHRTKHIDAFYASSTNNDCKDCQKINSTHNQSKQLREQLKTRGRSKILYLLTHPSFDNYFRIGSTSNLRSRLAMYKTSIPKPEELELTYTHESIYSEYLEWCLADILETHPECEHRQQSFFKIDRRSLLTIVKEVVENEEASIRYRNEQPSQSHLVLCN